MQTPAAILTIRLAVRDELLRELGALLDQAATQPGCQRTALQIDAQRAEMVTLVEEWTTRHDLDRHLRSDEFWRVLLLCELSAEAPEFSIDTVAAREGLDAIARSRAAGAHPTEFSPQFHQGGQA